MSVVETTIDLASFAEEIGATGPVAVVGGRTQWEVGGPPDAGTRLVAAPAGIAWIAAEEMTVCCGAGTLVTDLDTALAAHGQLVALPSWEGATVGGVLAVGHSGIRRLGYGPVRDTLLQARYVSAEGRLVKAGGPTVKNVSGYDLCRLLVGSLGTIGLIGEVILRTRPVPLASRWFTVATGDPTSLLTSLQRPSSVLWDGETASVLLEGHPSDIEAQAARLDLHEASGPPALPPHRWSVPPSDVGALGGTFVAEVGVGVVHHDEPRPPRPVDAVVADLTIRIRNAFDPTRRLNP
ncbi:MAG TPA: FAD-binding protein, partial [Acidimicrobiales bacterium]|nr:FAD-binding protein [Acidimicrobiales bacterium]